MRARIVFTLKNRGMSVPFHHQFLLAQVIKRLIVQGKKDEFLHFQEYNFSGLKGKTQVSRKGLHYYSSRITLVFSSVSAAFLEYIISVLKKFPEVTVDNLHLTYETATIDPEIKIHSEEKFLCLSPIVILPVALQDNENKKFIAPYEEKFSDLLYENTLNRMEVGGRFSSEELNEYYKFQIVPDQDYIARIQESNKKFARVYPLYNDKVKYEVRGYTFPFTLYAPPPVVQYIYENGIGYYNHKGFGMLDLAPAAANDSQSLTAD